VVVTRKTSLDLNVDLLAQAQEVLGTHGIKETIDRALYEVVVADARRRTIERLTSMDGMDRFDDELQRRAWGE
jgi:Arc/MetJ family transcription regulator